LFKEGHVVDPIPAMEFWRCPLAESKIEPYEPDGDGSLDPKDPARDVARSDQDAVWDARDPDGTK
jgi:hypothetical protein